MANTEGIEGYTQEQIDDMTDAEIQALKDFAAEDGGEPEAVDNDKDDDNADPEAKAAEAKQADPAGADAGADPAADADAAAAVVATPAEPAAVAAAEPGKPASVVQTAPVYVAEAPADAEEKLADIKTRLADTRAKYEAGELTFDQYEDTKDTLAEERAAINRQIDRAQLSQEMIRQQWLAEGERFAAENGYAVGSRHYAMLDLELRAVSADPANAHFTSPMQFLQKAHANLAADGFAPKGKESPSVAPAPAPKQKAAEVPKPALPPNLAFTPAAAASDAKNGQWAHIDNITDPDEREDAVKKLSEAQREAYLKAQ